MSIVSKWIIILISSLDLIFGLEIKSLESGIHVTSCACKVEAWPTKVFQGKPKCLEHRCADRGKKGESHEPKYARKCELLW